MRLNEAISKRHEFDFLRRVFLINISLCRSFAYGLTQRRENNLRRGEKKVETKAFQHRTNKGKQVPKNIH